MKKKILTGALILSSLFVFTACGNEKTPDAKELYTNAMKNVESYKSITFEVDGDLGATISTDSEGSESAATVKGSVGIDGKFSSNLSNEDMVLFMDTTLKYDIPTGANSENVKMYLTLEDNVIKAYTYDNDEKVWYFTESTNDEEISSIDFNKYQKDINDIIKDKGSYTLREKTEKVNDTECYVVDYTLTPSEIFDIVKNSSNFVKENSGDISEDVKESVEEALTKYEKYFENIKNIKSNTVMTVYISKDNSLPVKYIYDGSTFVKDVIDVLFDTVEQALNDYAEENGISEEDMGSTNIFDNISIDEITAKYEIIVTDYSDKEIVIPNEVVSNAIEE